MTGSYALSLICIALASYRVARLITKDSLTDPPRAWLWRKAFSEGAEWDESGVPTIVRRSRAWWYVYELASCPWCSGVWTSAVGYALWTWAPWLFVWHPLTAIAAIAGLQGFLGSRRDA